MILSLASVASKNLAPGVIVPVGIVTSLIGIPFFVAVVVLRRGRHDGRPAAGAGDRRHHRRLWRHGRAARSVAALAGRG
ncbi:hypothetical protein WJ978_11595 [Achromobacter xylosoxidans]